VTVRKCSEGDSTAELDLGTLKEYIKGCDWEMQLIFRGNDYMSMPIIYLKGVALVCDDQVTAHIKTKYPI
jgi:hypothetical protein